jgi:DNA polymerase-3 subunit epsilon
VSLLRRLTGRPEPGRAVPGWGEPGQLDLPWREAEFAVVDLETTGLDLRRDEIVSYGGVLVRAGRVVAGSAVYGLVKPLGPVSRASVEVHALRLEELDDAPDLAACAAALVELMSGRVLIAHAAWVERAFIGRALREIGLRLAGPVVDTAALAREAMVVPDRLDGEPALETLAGALGMPVHTPHHALGDALTTANVFLALTSRLERREPQTVRTLTAVSSRRSLH